MRVTVNGETRELPDETTLATVVALVTTAGRGVAVAVNDEVVSRAEWERTAVREADRVEILTAVQGG